MLIDLHCHTRMSDGSAGIDEVVQLAKNNGVQILSVTDHDTFAGNVRAQIAGKRSGVKVISGIELSAQDPETGRKAHVLGYLCKSPDRLEGLCKQIGDARKAACMRSAEKVAKLYRLPAQMILRRAQGSTNLYKQHIMHALVDAGCTGELFGSLYKLLFNPSNGLAYEPIAYPDVYTVIDAVHQAGGLAVLAHPEVYDSGALAVKLAGEKQIEGIEVYHPGNSAETQDTLLRLCKLYGLFATGGSDFHGGYSSRHIPIGSCVTPKEELDKMLALARS